MAYRLKPGSETVQDGIRRIAAEEFKRIADILANTEMPGPKQVHEVRKCTKKLRSLIRLIAPVFAQSTAENAVLRDAARTLSSARDSSAVLDSLQRLKLPQEAASSIEAALTSHLALTQDATGSVKLLKSFGRDMRAASKRATVWKLEAGGIDAIRPGMRRGYRRLRTDFAAAVRSGEEDATHDWRKSAKNHWHQTLLLGRICPDAMDAHARMASRLSACLGDWRDTGLFIVAVDAFPDGVLEKDTLKAAQRAASRDQKRLLKKAQHWSSLLTAEKPKALSARWTAYWEAGNF
ncbi:MAG: CHAD domain-containing protein [Hyphomonas sp.]